MLKMLAVLPVLALAGCGGGPTGPDPLESRLDFTFKDASPDQVAMTLALWEEQRVCTGFTQAGIRSVLIQVRAGGIVCGTTWAAGCTEPARIQVSAPHFEIALAHEFIHYVDLMRGYAQDYAHSGPLWPKCDWRNRGLGAVDIHNVQ